MAEPNEEPLGTLDLEKGLRPSPASTFRTIALNAVMLLWCSTRWVSYAGRSGFPPIP